MACHRARGAGSAAGWRDIRGSSAVGGRRQALLSVVGMGDRPDRQLGPAGFLPAARLGPTGTVRPGVRVRAPIDVHFNRTGATLDSIDVNVEPRLAHRHAAVYVLHREPGCSPYYSIVYRSRFQDTNARSAWQRRKEIPYWTYPYFGVRGSAPPFSAWSGALHPRDWLGGCQSGDFEIYVAMPIPYNRRLPPYHGPGPPLASYSTDDFKCRS